MSKKALRILITAAALTVFMTVCAFAADTMEYPIMGGTVVDTSTVLNFREAPSTSSDVLKKLADSSRVCVIGEEDGWYKAVYNGVTGYVSAEYIELQPIMNIYPGGAKISVSALNIREKPTTESDVIGKLYKDSIVEIIGINNGWYKIAVDGIRGYISSEFVEVVPYTGFSSIHPLTTPDSPYSSIREEIVAYAHNFLGVKYVYGGSTPKGFDCSGFTQYVYNHFGITLERNSRAQYQKSVTKISRSALQIGDLVFFSNNSSGGHVGHVGIYIGDGMFIHASSPGDYVKIDSLDSSFYSKHWIGGGTVFD